jgi:glucokinase
MAALAARPSVGLDLGGTKTLAVVVAPDGRVLGQALHPTPRQGRAALLDALEAAVREAVAQAGIALPDVLGVGVGVPGVTDASAGVLLLPPNLPEDCRGLPVGPLLGARLAVPVVVDNDANAAALGEHRFGAGRGADPMVYVTMSTGIGGGVVVGGRVLRGAGHAAGEVGHMVIAHGVPDRCGCGRTGCWEALSSGTALARQATEAIAAGRAPGLAARAAGRPVDARLVLEAAEAGDPTAAALVARAVEYSGIGFMNLIHLFGPQVIVVGGGLAHAWDRLVAPAAEWAVGHALGVPGATRIVRAALGDLAGALGAAALVAPGEVP